MKGVIATVIKFSTKGADAVVAAIGSVHKAAGVATRGIATLASSLGSMSGSLGNAASQVANFIFSVKQMGAVGGIIAGVQMAVTMISDHFIEAADKMAKAADKLHARVHEKLAKINREKLDGVAKELDKATVKAEKAARAFDILAANYLKVERAKVGTEASRANVSMAGLTLEKARAMAGASDENEAARIGAAYDEKIARARLDATRNAQEASVAGAEDELTQAKERAADARKNVTKARRALKKAEETYGLMVNSGQGEDAAGKEAKALKDKAKEAFDNAVLSQKSRMADAKVAEEKLKQAKDAQASALLEARREVVEAEKASRKLADAQKKSAHMKDLADLEKNAEKKKRDIELTHQQAKAEVELSIARAKASGKDKEASDLEMKAKELDALEKRDLAAASVAAARKKVSAAKGQDAKELEDARRSLAVALKEEAIVNVTNKQAMLSAKTDRMPDLASEVSRWQGAFDRAFDLWRDPEAAQRAQDESKARGEDLKRFQKTVSRYGGKGKIDEAARLMREGDEAGLQARLEQWRKSSKFNGQAEQLVLGEAARQNRQSAEKALEEINAKAASIDEKLGSIAKAFEGSAE